MLKNIIGKILYYNRKLETAHYVLLSFATAILLGGILLHLPISNIDYKPLPWVNSFFMATSAVCVTGLSLYNIGEYFTFFGQLIILLLIQFGGLGIMTFSTFFLLFFKGKMSLKSRFLIKETLADSPDVYNIKKLLYKIVLYTFVIEFVGAVIIYLSLPEGQRTIFNAIFHSVSAFCNAGFSLYSTSLENFSNNYLLVLTVGFLIILGGLGVVVIRDLFLLLKLPFRQWWNKINLQSKVVISVTFILLLAGTFAFVFTEKNTTLSNKSLSYKIVNAFFQSLTTRTAGFNSLKMSNLSDSTYVIMAILMFIGGSPGSTAGGIKTTTFAIIMGIIFMVIRNKKEVVLFRRKIPNDLIFKAITLTVLSIMLIIFITCVLLMTENYHSPIFTKHGKFLTLLFETISAFGTVGLSTGITPYLSNMGKCLITLLMYIGRVGPLTLFIVFAELEKPLNLSYPEGKLMIG